MAPVGNKQTNPAQKGGKRRRRRPVGTHFCSMARLKVETVDVIHFYTASVFFFSPISFLSFPSIYDAFKFCACYKNNVASLSSHVVDPPTTSYQWPVSQTNKPDVLAKFINDKTSKAIHFFRYSQLRGEKKRMNVLIVYSFHFYSRPSSSKSFP
jgi:hypothetical protein